MIFINNQLSNVLAIVEKTYKQECDRLETPNAKADNLTKYVSVLLVLLNLIIPIVLDYASFSLKYAILAYIAIFVPSITSLILAVKEQRSSKIYRFPTGHKLLKVIQKVEAEKGKEFTDKDWEEYNISQYDLAIEALEKNNNEKVREIRWAYNCYIFAIGMLTLFTFFLLLKGYLSTNN